jgi:nicotinate-nucleotide adenylyltransferase
MKFAMLGGSFNPVHNGHLKLAAQTLALGYDRVILVPAFQSPLKPAGQHSSAAVRVEMLLSAISGDKRFTVDMCEIIREGISYTVDTLADISARYRPEGKLGLVLGDDLIADFEAWRGADRIAVNAELIVAKRNFNKIEFAYPHKEMQNEVLTLSSNQVRNAISNKQEWHNFVQPAVAQIIERNGLYGCERCTEVKKAAALNKDAELEDFVRGKLDLKRFVHSRNVALHCADIAQRFGINAGTAWRAGLLHDICKCESNEAQLALALRDSEALTKKEKETPSLLHGRAGAVFLKETFGEQDEELLDAVRWHSTGKEGMNALAKLVYIADKIEVARATVDPELRMLAFGPSPLKNLDELYAKIYSATQEWLLKHGII